MHFIWKEKDARIGLFHNLSGIIFIAQVGQRGNEHGKEDSLILTLASINLLPGLKSLIVAWISSKIDIRKIFLQGSKTFSARVRLTPSVWSPTLFGHNEMDSIVNHPE